MENNYILYVGMDVSKGKADAAILFCNNISNTWIHR